MAKKVSVTFWKGDFSAFEMAAIVNAANFSHGQTYKGTILPLVDVISKQRVMSSLPKMAN